MTSPRDCAALLLLAVLLAGCSREPREAAAERPALPDQSQPAEGSSADAVRDGVARALREAASAPDATTRAAHFAVARALAAGYASTWSDSFLLDRVKWFESTPSARQRQSAIADSLWRAGRVAYGSVGVPEALRLWRESLRHAEEADDTAGRAVVLGALGAGFYATGDLDSASNYLSETRRLATEVGDHRTLGNAVGNLGSVAKDRGDLAAAAEFYEEASAIRPRSGDTRGTASDQNNLGLVARELGDLDAARRAFERALAINRVGGYSRYAAINLSNLGNLASLQGDYPAAQAAYTEALALNRAAGDLAEAAFVLHDLGLLAVRRGDFPAALAALTEAVEIHELSGAAAEAALVRSDLAAVQAAMGQFQGAAATLGGGGPDEALPAGVRARLTLARADFYLQLGRVAEAEAQYGRAERWFGEADDAVGLAETERARGLLLHLRDDSAGARRLLEPAARRQAAAGDVRGSAVTRLLLGEVQRAAGDTAAARRTIGEVLRDFASTGDVAGEVTALIARGDLSVDVGAPVDAEAWYQRGLARLGDRPMPDLRWRLLFGLGRAHRARGALDLAAARLDEAAVAVEAVASALPPGERRAGFLADKWQVHATLAQVEQSLGQPGRAFAASERMRGRQLLALLGRARVHARGEASAREQDLRRRISELTLAIETGDPGRPGSREPGLAGAGADATLEALDDAQRAYAELLGELHATDPEYLSMVSAEPAGWQAVARRLGPREVFLQYLLSESTSLVFVITPDTVAALDLGVRRREVAVLVDFARRGLDRPDADPGEPLWRSPLRRLHALLIEPVERAGYLEGRQALVIAPHAELHFLPFAALLDAGTPGRYLAERFDLVHTPSASIWVRRQSGARRPEPGRVLAMAPRPDRLPGSAAEVSGIGRIFGRRARTLSGREATEPALRSAAAGHDILHIATLGVLNKHNPLFSYIELAPGRDGDGRLEVHEVFDLDLQGQLVVLSACQTALASGERADVPAGDDWVGLVQSFLQAGAGAVVASLWRVQDRATAELMEEFYRRLARGESRAAALAGAQRALLRRPGTAHPFHWAGFVLSGSGAP